MTVSAEALLSLIAAAVDAGGGAQVKYTAKPLPEGVTMQVDELPSGAVRVTVTRGAKTATSVGMKAAEAKRRALVLLGREGT